MPSLLSLTERREARHLCSKGLTKNPSPVRGGIFCENQDILFYTHQHKTLESFFNSVKNKPRGERMERQRTKWSQGDQQQIKSEHNSKPSSFAYRVFRPLAPPWERGTWNLELQFPLLDPRPFLCAFLRIFASKSPRVLSIFVDFCGFLRHLFLHAISEFGVWNLELPLSAFRVFPSHLAMKSRPLTPNHGKSRWIKGGVPPKPWPLGIWILSPTSHYISRPKLYFTELRFAPMIAKTRKEKSLWA